MNKEEMVKIWRVPCEVYSRVVGYFRPVQFWNKGKAAEFEDRRTLNSTGSLGGKEYTFSGKVEDKIKKKGDINE